MKQVKRKTRPLTKAIHIRRQILRCLSDHQSAKLGQLARTLTGSMISSRIKTHCVSRHQISESSNMVSNVNTDSNKPRLSQHPGGDTNFWQNDIVQRYDIQQSLVSEKKAEALSAITRMINYFCNLHAITNPIMLDIGCGPGTSQTLASQILRDVPNSKVVGVDASEQMIQAAICQLTPVYAERFTSSVSDFNSNDFWIDLPNSFDFVLSSGALHYLSDARRIQFLVESYNHLKKPGIFIAGIGTSSAVLEIGEMEQLFRAEYTYYELGQDKRPNSFSDFRKSFQEVDSKASINWASPLVWLDAFREAGFTVDIVWHLWCRSIFLGIKK